MSECLKPASEIKARLGIQEGGPVHAFFTDTCYKHMSKFVPGGTRSHLNKNVDLQVDSITYQSTGAKYLYNGILMIDPKYKVGAFPIRGGKISFNKSDGPIEGFRSRKGIPKLLTTKTLDYHTPGTGAFWDKRMWTSEGNKVINEVQKFVDRGCK